MGHPDMMYVGVYDGLFLLKKQAGKWTVVCKIAGIADSCRMFEQESSHVVWVCASDRFVRFELNEAMTKAVSNRSYAMKDGLPTDRELYLAKVEGRVYFTTSKGVYKYNMSPVIFFILLLSQYLS